MGFFCSSYQKVWMQFSNFANFSLTDSKQIAHIWVLSSSSSLLLSCFLVIEDLFETNEEEEEEEKFFLVVEGLVFRPSWLVLFDRVDLKFFRWFFFEGEKDVVFLSWFVFKFVKKPLSPKLWQRLKEKKKKQRKKEEENLKKKIRKEKKKIILLGFWKGNLKKLGVLGLAREKSVTKKYLRGKICWAEFGKY